MPNRILREGILTSPRMAKLGWAEEVFYRRLMSVVDDFGRYYADPGLLRAACYPRQLNKVSDPDIGKWLRNCVDAALVRVYPASDGESYLQLLDFRQQARAAKSKYPEAPSACIAPATQPPSTSEAPAPVFVSEDVSEDVSGETARKRATSPEKPPDVEQQTWDDWLALRKAKRAPVTQTVVDGAGAEAMKAGMSLDAFLRVWCRRGSQGLDAAWLKPDEVQGGKSFKAQDAENAAREVAEWTGNLLDARRDRATVIDMEDPRGPIRIAG